MFAQKIHFKAIFGTVGLMLQVPVVMVLISIIVALVFGEIFSIIPFLVTGTASFLIGFCLYRFCYAPKSIHLWDAMVIAALSWFLCPLICAIPFYWISYEASIRFAANPALNDLLHPLNALFESFSGFTSTGLTMVKNPEQFPYTVQWWRSLTEWVGGIGLIVLVITLTQPNRQEFQLYYAEARSENIGKNVTHTSQVIWIIYCILTVVGLFAFYLAGMPFWQAINHSMCAISNGGFTITPNSFEGYNAAIKIIGVLIMLFGAMSFAIHYHVLREGKFFYFYKDSQQRMLAGVFFIGITIGLLLNIYYQGAMNWIDVLFQWTSAFATCGFDTANLQKLSPTMKLWLTYGMLIGGAAGSTAGGIKLVRFKHLLAGVGLRIKSITNQRERFILQKESMKAGKELGTGLPKTVSAEKLYAAGILFTMWMVTVFIGWFLLMFSVSELQGVSSLFEVLSAMSNVGLDMGLIGPSFPNGGKVVYILLMYLGRLEILPALILFFSWFSYIGCLCQKKKKRTKAA